MRHVECENFFSMKLTVKGNNSLIKNYTKHEKRLFIQSAIRMLHIRCCNGVRADVYNDTEYQFQASLRSVVTFLFIPIFTRKVLPVTLFFSGKTAQVVAQ